MDWRDTALTRLLGNELPIVLAPLAGGPSTPALAAAVSEAGGLGSLGVAYLSPDAIRDEVREVRRRTARPFAVGLLLQGTPDVDAAAVESAWARLAPYRGELGLPDAAPPSRYSESLDAQVAVLLEERVPAVAFAFGLPEPEVVAAFRERGTVVILTVAGADEARLAERAGADVIAAQGDEAGGHRGGLSSDGDGVPLRELVPAVCAATSLPVLAAGGIMDGRGIVAALGLGAAGAQLGTAFLCTPEAGTSAPYRAALRAAARSSPGGGATEIASPAWGAPEPADKTRVIRGISGRPARGIWNRIAEELADLPATVPYPVLNAMTRDVRRRAAELGRPEFLSLWAGTGVAAIRELPAAALVERLAAETDAAFAASRS
jgi:nitronate monooxygenase